MPRRRGKGEGSISERPDGRWQVQVDLGRGIDGRRRRKYIYTATERDAIAELKKLHARTVGGQVLATSTPTVGQYLEDWFTTNRETWRASTQRSYRGVIDNYLVPVFGPIRLEQLAPLAVQRWLNEHKTQHGARRRITLAHSVLRSALTSARGLQLVATNVAELVTVPNPKRKRAVITLDVDQAKVFLAAAARHRLSALFIHSSASILIAAGVSLEEVSMLLGHSELRVTQDLYVHLQKQTATKAARHMDPVFGNA